MPLKLTIKPIDHLVESKLIFTTRIILTVMPDFGGAYVWTNRYGNLAHGVGGCSGSRVFGWGPEPDISEQLERDFEIWQSNFESADWEDFRGFDWEGFHQRGMALAVRLKAEIGEAAMVIYEKPFEDPNCRIQERLEVLQGGQFRALLSRRKMQKLLKENIDE